MADTLKVVFSPTLIVLLLGWLVIEGEALTVMTTSSVEGEQGALEIVHLNVADAPITNPVTPEVGDEGVVIVAVPETTDQFPVPTVGVLPANVVVVTLQRFWSEPALAVVGLAFTVNVATLLVAFPQALVT